MTCVISTTGAEHITKNMTYKEELEVVIPKGNREGERRFPDNEVYARIPEAGELENRIVILHSGGPDPNSGYVELDMLLEILQKENRISHDYSLEVFFTYFAYSCQDSVFRIGETNFAENIVKKLTEYYNVDRIYGIDLHYAKKEWVKEFPVKNVSAFDKLKKAASIDYPDTDILYLAPDIGSQRRTGLDGVEKTRLDSYTTKIQDYDDIEDAVNGRLVGVVDDMIRTGGTMINFYDICTDFGADEVIALATHGVIEPGIERIQDKYSKLYLTNTIDRKQSNVDITDLVVDTIKI